MSVPPGIPVDEADRLVALQRLEILDTESEESFDGLAELAAMHCDVPIALFSLVADQRQWFKSRIGIGATETPRSSSFCAHAIMTPDYPLVIEDATNDQRFFDNPLVTGPPNIRSYMGVPISAPNDGLPLGTLCVIDTVPREFSPDQRRTLELLANQVEHLLQLRADRHLLVTTTSLLSESNESLEMFTRVAAHDLKTPIRGIRSLVSFIREDHGGVLGSGIEQLDRIDERAAGLTHLVDDLLDYARLPLAEVARETFDFTVAVADIGQSLAIRDGIELRPPELPTRIQIARIPLLTCVRNLIDNAVRHHPGPVGHVTVGAVALDDDTLEVSVADDGCGIDPINHQKIFEIFESLRPPGAQSSTGLGLAAVARISQRHGGTVRVESELGEGAIFKLQWPGQMVHAAAILA